jgi:PRP38 family
VNSSCIPVTLEASPAVVQGCAASLLPAQPTVCVLQMEQHGNTSTYNFETVLRKNVVDSEYYRKTCMKLQTVEDLIDQVYYDVFDVEPWMSGNARGASSAFCLLYRLGQLKPMEEQIQAFLDHTDSPYIRAVSYLLPKLCKLSASVQLQDSCPTLKFNFASCTSCFASTVTPRSRKQPTA